MMSEELLHRKLLLPLFRVYKMFFFTRILERLHQNELNQVVLLMSSSVVFKCTGENWTGILNFTRQLSTGGVKNQILRFICPFSLKLYSKLSLWRPAAPHAWGTGSGGGSWRTSKAKALDRTRQWAWNRGWICQRDSKKGTAPQQKHSFLLVH